MVEMPARMGLGAGSPAPAVQSYAQSYFQPRAAGLSLADLRVVQTVQVVTPATNMSELPEPEVFAMMLLGLCLIGYRASRHSDEKFE